MNTPSPKLVARVIAAARFQTSIVVGRCIWGMEVTGLHVLMMCIWVVLGEVVFLIGFARRCKIGLGWWLYSIPYPVKMHATCLGMLLLAVVIGILVAVVLSVSLDGCCWLGMPQFIKGQC